MGSSGVDDTPTSQKIINYLDELSYYALALGMPAKEYWEDEPRLILTYIGADKIKTQKMNYELWLQGLYVYHAIGCLVPVLNPFSKEHKARAYMSEPVPLTEEERQLAFERKIEKYLNSLVGLKPKGGQ